MFEIRIHKAFGADSVCEQNTDQFILQQYICQISITTQYAFRLNRAEEELTCAL